MKYDIDPELSRVGRMKQGHLNKFILKMGDLYLKNTYKVLNKCEGIHYKRIKITDTCHISVIIPDGIKGTVPCNINFHGGAFCFRGYDNHFMLPAAYARGAGMIVVYVDYALSYNTEFNVTLDDCKEAVKWIIGHHEEFGIDLTRVSVSGDSAGGFLALEIHDYLVRNDILKPNGLMLIYPVVDPLMRTESMKKYTDTPVWNSVANKEMWELYLKGNKVESYLDKDISYIQSCFIESAEFDCLHDEDILLYERLKAIPHIVLNETKGTVHGYDIDMEPAVVKESVKKRIDYLLEINASQK